LVFVVDAARDDLKAPRLERVDEGGEGERVAGASEGAGGMSEVALSLSAVVRLSVGLAGHGLVGQLGVAAVGEGVVCLRTVGGPFPELAAGASGGVVKLVS
jgi:hypothetical protein